MSSDGFLDVAAAIARRIVAEAIWHEGHCSWVGAVATPAKRSRPEYRPVGPYLYDGTAGIGLFLAQLWAVTGDEALRRTALGALRHAVSRARGHGLYAGAPGVAWAATRVAILLGTAEPLRRLDLPATDRADLRSGTAGTIVALLGRAGALDDPALVSAAADLGETLFGWSGPAGFIDGAAGIDAALAALAAVTGDARFQTTVTARGEQVCAPPGVPHAWCTGLTGPTPHGQYADTLRDALSFAIDDLSLCHGATGPAFALLESGDRDIPTALGHVAVERHAAHHDWPCGVYGTTPSLFRGLAGIGWFLLALTDSTTPSPLTLPGAVDSSETTGIRSPLGPTRR